MESLQLTVLNLDFDSSQEKSTQGMASMLESSGSSELMSTMPWLRAKLSRCAKLMWVDIHLWRTRNSTSIVSCWCPRLSQNRGILANLMDWKQVSGIYISTQVSGRGLAGSFALPHGRGADGGRRRKLQDWCYRHLRLLQCDHWSTYRIVGLIIRGII